MSKRPSLGLRVKVSRFLGPCRGDSFLSVDERGLETIAKGTLVGQHGRNFDGSASCRTLGDCDEVSANERALRGRPCHPRRTKVLLASMCQESALQGILLPQVLLGNEHQLSVRTLRTLRPSLPNNLHIWREKSAWTNTGLIKRYLSLLARSLGNVVEKRTVLVLMDMNPSHLDYSLIAHARRLSLRLVLVPAKMTKWLQPADVALFNKLKKSFRAKWCEVKSTSPQGTVSQEQWLHLICSAVQEVLLGFCWRAVFASTGLLGSQEAISESLCQELGLDTPPQVPERSPTRSEAVVLFPARTKVEVLAWIHFCPKSKVPLCCPPPVSYYRGQAVRRLE